MPIIYIGLGSNLGNKEENIHGAIEFIREKCEILKTSSLYEAEPVGYKDQDWFLNCVIKAETSLSPRELLRFLQSIESKLGRVLTVKNGPRIIDLDILFYNGVVVQEDDLVIPHLRLHERLFVLMPLCEIIEDQTVKKL